MKKISQFFARVITFFFNLFATEKAKTNRVLSKGNKRLVQVLVEKNTRKKEMIAWLRKATNHGKRFNAHQKQMLLIKKFGQEMADRNISIQVQGNQIGLKDARA